MPRSKSSARRKKISHKSRRGYTRDGLYRSTRNPRPVKDKYQILISSLQLPQDVYKDKEHWVRTLSLTRWRGDDFDPPHTVFQRPEQDLVMQTWRSYFERQDRQDGLFVERAHIPHEDIPRFIAKTFDTMRELASHFAEHGLILSVSNFAPVDPNAVGMFLDVRSLKGTINL